MKEEEAKQEALKSLIIQAKNGEGEAFEEIYTTYYTPIYRYMVSRIKDSDTATDLTQTVFIKIWNSIPNWNPSHTSPIAFFFTVARNTLIDHFRKSSSKEIVSDEVVYKHTDSKMRTDADATRVELKEDMSKAIASLSSDQQEVIRLLYGDDRTYEEIAEITGKREDAIRQTHSRALKKLREIYKPE